MRQAPSRGMLSVPMRLASAALLCAFLACTTPTTAPPPGDDGGMTTGSDGGPPGADGGTDPAKPLPPGWTVGQVVNLSSLGPTLVAGGGVNFAVWSHAATRVELLLFPDSMTYPKRRLVMSRYGDVWNLYVPDVGVGQVYGFRAWGPNWPYDPAFHTGSTTGFVADVDAQGNRFNPNKVLLDPYMRAIDRVPDALNGEVASGFHRDEYDFIDFAKSIVAGSSYSWSSGETSWRNARQNPTAPGHRWSDLVVYEVHPKGFTANTSSGVQHPGTFRGVGEKADYLKDLGITAVELLPSFQKPSDGGYWGYNTIGFFAPELTYAADRSPNGPTDEFKWMVDQLHQRGIEVLLDVVYNHTGEGSLWTVLLQGEPQAHVANVECFRGLDNAAYYALESDGAHYHDNTGVGNETRCNNTPMHKLILDSLHYWATDMHVDGFRFDLAPILGEQDGTPNSWDPQHTILQDIVDDPVLRAGNVRVVAEPWSVYGSFVGAFPASSVAPGVGWYEWNGRFRDWWRAFANDDTWNLSSEEGPGGNGGFLLTGSYDWYHGNGRRPYHSVNYVSIHDGFTLYDVFSYAAKHNGCGPLNPACCLMPPPADCHPESGEDNNRSRDWGTDEVQKRALMRMMFAAMAVAHGTPMLQGGDEWMRTLLGNNNAYPDGSDSAYSWFDWANWQQSPERARMHDFVKQVIRLRKSHPAAFAVDDYSSGQRFAWKDENNNDNATWTGKHVAMHYWDAASGPQLDVLINGEPTPVTFTLPSGVAWKRLVDTQPLYDSAGYFAANPTAPLTASANASLDAPPAVGAMYTVAPRSIVVVGER